jgi:hypothetical protein
VKARHDKPICVESSRTGEIYTDESTKQLRHIREPMDFAVENYEHQLTRKDPKLLDSGNNENK